MQMGSLVSSRVRWCCCFLFCLVSNEFAKQRRKACWVSCASRYGCHIAASSLISSCCLLRKTVCVLIAHSLSLAPLARRFIIEKSRWDSPAGPRVWAERTDLSASGYLFQDDYRFWIRRNRNWVGSGIWMPGSVCTLWSICGFIIFNLFIIFLCREMPPN